MCLQLDFCGVVCLVGIKRVQTEIEITGLSETQLQRHHEVHHYCLVMRLDSKPPKVLKLRLETNPFFHGDGCLRNFLLQTSKNLEVVAASKPTNSPTPRNTQRYVDLYTFGHFVYPYTTLPSGKQQGVNDLFYTYRPAWH